MAAAAEVMASVRWCQASVRTAVLPTVSPTLKTNRNRVSLVTTTARSNQIVKGFGVR